MELYNQQGSLKFPKFEKDLVLRKPFFAQQVFKKFNFFDFFAVKFYDGQTSFSSENDFSQVEISDESKGVLFDQMKVSERRTESKKLKCGNFHNQNKSSPVPYDQK